MEWLRSYRPDLVPRYEELYARSAYAPKAEQQRLQALLHRPGTRFPSRFDRDEGKPARGGRRSQGRTGSQAAKEARPGTGSDNRARQRTVQESLF